MLFSAVSYKIQCPRFGMAPAAFLVHLIRKHVFFGGGGGTTVAATVATSNPKRKYSVYYFSPDYSQCYTISVVIGLKNIPNGNAMLHISDDFIGGGGALCMANIRERSNEMGTRAS